MRIVKLLRSVIQLHMHIIIFIYKLNNIINILLLAPGDPDFSFLQFGALLLGMDAHCFKTAAMKKLKNVHKH